MTPIYIGYNFTISPLQPATEILIAELGYAGFESFVETKDGVSAYIQKQDWNENILEDIYVLSSNEFNISYSFEEIEQVNWNKEWEKNFDPITVDDTCCVRAPFHEKPDVEFDIVIEPKMSFGTGHHETTHMMIQHLLKMDVAGKKTLDMGCGTGVLAILKAYEGESSLLVGKSYDLIIANINRNILINDMEQYSTSLNKDGDILLSGFYIEDLELIKSTCAEFDLKYQFHFLKNKWVAAHFKKVY